MDADLKHYYGAVQDYDWTKAATTLSPEGFFHRLRLRATLEAIRKHGQAPYADIGCGSGLVTRYLPAGTVAADLNPRNLERVARYAPQAKPVLADAERLPFADGSFGTVVLTEVLEHFRDPRPLLAELRRVLAPGGVLIGTTPRDSALWKLRGLSFSCTGEQREPFHREFSRYELEATLRAAFEEVRIRRAAFGACHLFVCARR